MSFWKILLFMSVMVLVAWLMFQLVYSLGFMGIVALGIIVLGIFFIKVLISYARLYDGSSS